MNVIVSCSCSVLIGYNLNLSLQPGRNMPLFSSNKFSPKKIPQRKSRNNPKKKPIPGQEEEKFENDKIKLNIGDQQCVFDDGEWIPGKC